MVDPRLSPHQKASIIAHELGHVHAGHVDSSPGEYRQHRGQWRPKRRRWHTSPAANLASTESSEAFSPGYIAGWMSQQGANFQTALSGR